MFAFYQHWLVTRDVAWLKSTAYPIIDVRVCVCVCVCVSVCARTCMERGFVWLLVPEWREGLCVCVCVSLSLSLSVRP